MTLSSTFPFSLAFALPKVRFFKVSSGLISCFTIMAIFAVASLWLWQNFQVVETTYQLQRLQNKLGGLERINEVLEVKAIGGNSLLNLEKKIQELGLEKIENINFLSYPETTVVTR